ncbi:MAG: hypothetical protein ACREA9_04810 [Pyrinomonadaceae bacterium]
MEEAFFADDSKFEALELAEDELIDAYVRNELSPEEQRQFQAKLLTSPRIVERVNFARALTEKTSQPLSQQQEADAQPEYSVSHPAPKPKARWWEGSFALQPALRMALAACIVLILLGGVTLVTGWLRLRGESDRLAAERAAVLRQKEDLDKQSTEQRARTEQLTADLQQARDQRAEDLKRIEELQRNQKPAESGQRTIFGTITLLLAPGSLRSGGGGPQLTVGPETSTAQLNLLLQRNEYPRYSVSIKTADGAVIFSQKRLKPHKTGSGEVLGISVPSRRLSPGDYTVHVDGLTSTEKVESVEDYEFRVTKK